MISRKKAQRLIRLRRTVRIVKVRIAAGVRCLISFRKPIGLSVLSSFLLLCLTYLVDSSPFPMGDELNISQWIEYFRHIENPSANNIPDSICLINVAFDKVLVDYDAPLYVADDSETMFAGQVAITDREKLLDFLSIADSLGSYRYILLDVRFEQEIPDDSVSRQLFSLISGMDSIVYARHDSAIPAEGAPISKAALGDYYNTILVPGFVKYPILSYSSESRELESSMSAKMFADLHDSRFSSRGWFTFNDGKLCYRAIYPTFPVRLKSWAEPYSQDFELPTLVYRNLGEDILLSSEPEKTIESLIDNRIVVIGDFIDDIHSTYVGYQPGALINLNSYIALCRGDHLVNWWGVITQFILYFLITWCIINHLSIFGRIKFLKSPRLGLLRFFLSFIGFSVVLISAAAFVYIVFGTILNIVLPSLYFSILHSCAKKDS